jgi:predicted TIM-barrel fold metal-dependent hydrolase
MIVDTHPHVISSDTKRYPSEPLVGHKSDWSRERPVSVEQMIVAMDHAGIKKSALVQASTCYGHDNRYVADVVEAYPDRFTGVFSVDMRAPDAPEKIRYWVDRKLTGLRVFIEGSATVDQAERVDDPRSFSAWQSATDLGLPVCMQMRAKAIPQLVHMIERFPKVRIILDHLARPSLEDGPPYTAAAGLFGLAQYPNVYLKLTPWTFSEVHKGRATPESFFPLLVSKFGAPRLAWGSNFPRSEGTLPEILRLAQDSLSVLPANDREWIFCKTALTLYPALAHN